MGEEIFMTWQGHSPTSIGGLRPPDWAGIGAGSVLNLFLAGLEGFYVPVTT